MARIAGVNIPNHQHTVIGLTAIFGIGTTRAHKICLTTGVAIDKKIKDKEYVKNFFLKYINKFISLGADKLKDIDEPAYDTLLERYKKALAKEKELRG